MSSKKWSLASAGRCGLPLTNEEYQQFLKTPFQFYQQLDLPAGEMFVKMGIVDGVSDKVGTLEIPLTVAREVESAACLPGISHLIESGDR